MGKHMINNPFWYLCDTTAGCVCLHRKVGNRPKYKIVPSIDAGAVLDVLSDDFKEDKQTLAFEPVDRGDAISEAMRFAEHYEAASSRS